MIRFSLFAALLLSSNYLLATNATTVAVHTLDNGLKIVVQPDSRAPVVVSQIWYKIGSSYEHNGITGISHVLEHMMFQGTEKYPSGEFSRIVAANGGKENAFTGRDYTAYYQQLEKSRLKVSFELEADRMVNLRMNEKEFQKERDVVIEERRLRTEDKPPALAYEQFMAAAFQNNPYHQPIIGWLTDLQQLTLQELTDWYHLWYAPNNATLVVAGDVVPEDVFALAQQYFGDIPPSKTVATKSRKDPPQKGQRTIVVNSEEAKVPALFMGYKAPVLRTAETAWHAYALEILAYVLDGGDSARLSRELVRGKEIAASASAGYDIYARHDSLFTLDAVPVGGVTLMQLQTELLAQIQRLQQQPVTTTELQRIKNQLIAGKVYKRDSLFYQAMQLGQLETVGLGWETGRDYLQNLAAITAEQLQQVAKIYLQPSSLTITYLEPVAKEKI